MEISQIIGYVALGIGTIIALTLIISSFVIVQQGTIAVITQFGRYKKIMRPGLGFRIPIIQQVESRISIQNKSAELKFQAITSDQANVYFKAMLLYSVMNQDEETIKNVAYKFVDWDSFQTALTRTVESSIRGYVATKKQQEVLGLRNEITSHVKEQIDATLAGWGYHLQDMQLNDITFDAEIINSMSKVVASSNLKMAAENEGQALLITKTKAAEAEGKSIIISAESEKTAAKLRGEGVALFRKEVAKGMTEAGKLLHEAELDTSMIAFGMWTETLKQIAENGKGNVMFFDGSVDNMQRTLKQMMAMGKFKTNGVEV
jgi:prepilin-type processing-associated H-X9-DG protein